MSLSKEDLESHCRQILGDRRIQNKIVVLCEGKIKDIKGRRSPQAYKRMEQMPDANFYKKCVPKSWIDKPRPQFFNCGDRKDVINTYFQLLELHDLEPELSYLNKTKLFALVDLDIQLQKIENYTFSNTEEIFHNLYKKTKVISDISEKIEQHRIQTTGLIHKEAYFIAPCVREVFDRSFLYPQYKNNSVSLEDIYLKICAETTNDRDFKNSFDRVVKRVDYCQQIDCCDIEKFKQTWKQEFTKSSSNRRKKELIFVLLTVRKAKKYWNQIEPDSSNINTERFREQLSLEIGEAYSRLDWSNPEHHLAFFFKSLYELA